MIVFRRLQRGHIDVGRVNNSLSLILLPPPLSKIKCTRLIAILIYFQPLYPKLLYFSLGGEKIKRGHLGIQSYCPVWLSSEESTPHVLCYKCCLARLQVAGK